MAGQPVPTGSNQMRTEVGLCIWRGGGGWCVWGGGENDAVPWFGARGLGGGVTYPTISTLALKDKHHQRSTTTLIIQTCRHL